jgi:hypothetical protein
MTIVPSNENPGQTPPGVAAIVVSYFTGPLLARSIAALRAQPDITEIILRCESFPGKAMLALRLDAILARKRRAQNFC